MPPGLPHSEFFTVIPSLVGIAYDLPGPTRECRPGDRRSTTGRRSAQENAMPAFDFHGKVLEINEEGFLAHPEEWTEELAAFLAREEESLDHLTDEHWAVIRFIRQHYEEKQSAPMVRSVCKATGLPLKRVYELFPSGPAKGACKLAGLPKPDGCV
jgi:TusE/DsrC/DsvC family sulfur relay protein